ncbi:hypothetical protein CCHR01_17481 [Colletotrichum chrysophilum]|uniref:Uncharacterized protein n=1 Tax=Colletotrichum chrysophilum TaxID=1836956 RepID=A0AAD9A1W5_9PEZI|nr:hypothetical protein CCHR01_17481 [Colletotrichum chrysophilum]
MEHVDGAYGNSLFADAIGSAEAAATLAVDLANAALAGSQLAALRGRVNAKRAGGGEGGEGSDEEDLEVHGDGVLVVFGLKIVFLVAIQ